MESAPCLSELIDLLYYETETEIHIFECARYLADFQLFLALLKPNPEL